MRPLFRCTSGHKSPYIQRFGGRYSRLLEKRPARAVALGDIRLDRQEKQIAQKTAKIMARRSRNQCARHGLKLWLSKELKLEVNRAKSGAGPTEQSGLLGFRIDQEGTIAVGNKAIQRLRELWNALQGKTSEELRQQWQQHISGWWNYFQLAEDRREIERLSGWIRRHIRKCFWQRWHGSQGREKALRRLGISGPTLALAKCTRGAWRMAAHYVMQKALSNRTLQRYGFIIPWQDATAN